MQAWIMLLLANAIGKKLCLHANTDTPEIDINKRTKRKQIESPTTLQDGKRKTCRRRGRPLVTALPLNLLNLLCCCHEPHNKGD